MNKAELREWLKEKYRVWRVFLEPISLASMEKPGVNGDWSMKDMIAHLTGWHTWLITRMQAAQRGEQNPTPPWPRELENEDDINAWIYSHYHGLPAEEVLDEMNEVFLQLFATVDDLPMDARIEKVDPGYYFAWIGGQRFWVSEFFDHYRDDHEADVLAWQRRMEDEQANFGA